MPLYPAPVRTDVYNAKSYRLVGDDSTNDSSALTALLAAVSAAGGGCVYFPPGTYLLSPSLSIPSNTTLCGVRGQSKLHFTATAAGQIGLYIDGRTTAKTNIILRDLVIYSNAAAYSGNTVIAYGIYLDNSTTGATESGDILIDGCDISQFALAGFSGNSNTSVTRRLVIQNSYFHDIGTSTHAPGAVAVGISNPPFGECAVRNNRFYNIGTTSSDWAVYLSRTSTDCRIEGNVIKDCAGGIQLFSSVSQNAAIANNTIHNPTAAWAIAVGGVAHKNIAVHGNVIWLATNTSRGAITVSSLAAGTSHSVCDNVIDCGSVTLGNGAITVTGACPDTLIAGNVLYNLGSNMYGVYVTGTSGALRRLRVRGNTMLGASGARGVWFREAAGTDEINDAEVVGNKIFGGTYGVVLTGTARCKVIENEVTLSTGSNTECVRLEDGAGANTTPLQAEVRLNRGQAQNTNNYISYCGNCCRVEQNVGFAVRLTPTMTDTNCTVRHNFGLGVAPIVTMTSGATPSLAAETLGSEAVKLTYSGATTITSFSGCFAGEVRRFFATNGNVTLQNNATIVLAGGADKTLAANGSITLLFDGTAYREVV